MSQSLSQPIKNFLEKFLSWQKKPTDQDSPKIQLSEIVSKMSYVYEKIRNAVDYNEEHLLRKNAIRRIVKRNILIEKRDSLNMAKFLLYELVRARYLKNDSIPETQITEIQNIMKKYLLFWEQIRKNYPDPKELNYFFEWFLDLVACEIDEYLVPMEREKALAEAMLQVLKKETVFVDFILPGHEKQILLLVATYRSLLKADIARLRYWLFSLYHPEWDKPTVDQIENLAGKFKRSVKIGDYFTNHPLNFKLLKLGQKYAPYFVILYAVVHKEKRNIKEVLADQELLEQKITQACEIRYEAARKKLRRGIIRSIIYLFLTKMLIAILIEVPVDRLIENKFHLFPLVINIIFPPLLLFFVGVFIKTPSKENTARIISGIKEISFNLANRKVINKLKQPIPRWSASFIVFTFIYAATYIITFGLILWFLSLLNFSLASTVIFILFLTLVSFFGFRIRQSVRGLIVVPGREKLRGFLWDFFTLPIIRLGRWISSKSQKINVFIMFFDFIIEAPFKILVEVLESMLGFFREKKDEVG